MAAYNEEKVVKKTKSPNTIESLKLELQELGIKKASVIVMHTAMSKLGWTVGGAVSVINAIIDLLTFEGTLVMPAFSSDNTEPSNWQNPPVPEEWWPIIRKNMPAYLPEITPTRGIGIVPEVFRKYPDVIRSSHPALSFAAWGKHKKAIVSNHKLDSGFGEDSPLARLYDLNAQILLLGVTHSNNTSLHLAEYRTTAPKKYLQDGSSMLVNNTQKWVRWKDLDHDSDDFEEIGKAFESENQYTPGKVGLAEARLFSQREIVDFAVKWMNKHRN